jgi:hypothetical protein
MKLAQEQEAAFEPLDKTYDNEYVLVLKGFDAKVVPSKEEPGLYNVELFESGVKVFEDLMPAPSGSEESTPFATVSQVVQTAIDFFEASRDTLGLGATCMLNKKSSVGSEDINWSLPTCLEEDFRSFVCTEQEYQAIRLMQQFVFTEIEIMNLQAKFFELSAKNTKVFQDLLSLDLERLINCKDADVEVIILASMLSNDIDKYLSKFRGTQLESKALQLCAFAMDVFREISELEAQIKELQEKKSEFSCQMEDLKTEALASSIQNDLQEISMFLLPEASKSLMDLSDGVSTAENPLNLLNLS